MDLERKVLQDEIKYLTAIIDQYKKKPASSNRVVLSPSLPSKSNRTVLLPSKVAKNTIPIPSSTRLVNRRVVPVPLPPSNKYKLVNTQKRVSAFKLSNFSTSTPKVSKTNALIRPPPILKQSSTNFSLSGIRQSDTDLPSTSRSNVKATMSSESAQSANTSSQSQRVARVVVNKYKIIQIRKSGNESKGTKPVLSQRSAKKQTRFAVDNRPLSVQNASKTKGLRQLKARPRWFRRPFNRSRVLVNEGGARYHMNARGTKLRRISFSRQGKYKWVSASNSQSQIVARQLLRRSIITKYRLVNKKPKLCAFFHRFGKCSRGLKCRFVHDPTRVAVCRKFLRGKCLAEKCMLSHRVSGANMPTCWDFLRGICVRENCPYAHVNVGRDAEVCAEFLEHGFCPLAESCPKKHNRKKNEKVFRRKKKSVNFRVAHAVKKDLGAPLKRAHNDANCRTSFISLPFESPQILPEPKKIKLRPCLD